MSQSLSHARKVCLDTFYEGASQRDVVRVRSALTDDFTFESPIGNHDNPDSFARSLLEFDGDVSGSRMIADGDSVVHLFVLDIGVKIPMCDVIEFRENRISKMVTYTDSRLFESNAQH